jgi:hypothetical protein
MDKPVRVNNAGIALPVIGHSSGDYRQRIIFIGLGSGYARDIVFGNFQALVSLAKRHSSVVFGIG